MSDNEIKVVSMVNGKVNQDNYENSRQKSCGEKPRKSVQRRKKEVERKKKKIAILVIGAVVTVAVMGIGIKTYHDNLPQVKLENTLETVKSDSADWDTKSDAIDELGDNIYNNIDKSGVVVNQCTKPATGGGYYYDFDGVQDKFSIDVINNLQEYGISWSEGDELWDKLTDEEKEALIIDACVDNIKSYEGGQVGVSDFVRHVVDHESYKEYQDNEEQFFEETEEMAKDAADKMAKMMVEEKLGYSLDSYANNISNGRSRG